MPLSPLWDGTLFVAMTAFTPPKVLSDHRPTVQDAGVAENLRALYFPPFFTRLRVLCIADEDKPSHVKWVRSFVELNCRDSGNYCLFVLVPVVGDMLRDLGDERLEAAVRDDSALISIDVLRHSRESAHELPGGDLALVVRPQL